MTTATRTETTAWAFRTRFRRGAFGWKSTQLAIGRIHEALTEIRAVACHDPALAAEGAVLLEKLSPTLCNPMQQRQLLRRPGQRHLRHGPGTGTSDQLGAREHPVRSKWLDRLFEAIQEDDPPYIESLGDHWGALCATQDLASAWADQLLPTLRNVLRERTRSTYAFFSGTSLCYSSLFTAHRHDQILELLAMDTRPIWP